MQGDRERCLAAGADEYLSKPVNLKVLVREMERCCGSDCAQRRSHTLRCE